MNVCRGSLAFLVFIISFISVIANADPPLRVLVIDAGTPEVPFNYPVMGKDISELPSKDKLGHASCVYQMVITGQADGIACLNMKVDWCTWYMGKATSPHYYYDCLRKAVDGKYDIVNLSINGTVYDPVEDSYIKQLRNRSMVVIAAGNNGCSAGLKECSTYPALYSNGPNDSVLAIAALTKDGTRASYSNYDPKGLTIDFLGEGYYSYNHATRFMTGTSMAAALYSNKLIKEMCPSRKGKNIEQE